MGTTACTAKMDSYSLLIVIHITYHRFVMELPQWHNVYKIGEDEALLPQLFLIGLVVG